jgi:hypothetical protein
MSVSAVSTVDSLFAQLNRGSQKASSSEAGGNTAASFALYLASFRSQTLGSLIGSGSASDSSGLGAFLGVQDTATSPSSAIAGSSSVDALLAAGRNSGLTDPESAYSMMTFINQEDVAFKAQFSELSAMKSAVAGMQQDGSTLAGITMATADSSIESQLQSFADQYNAWVKRFDADLQSGGILAGTRAAQVSRYELEQSVRNVFTGAQDGVNGLAGLGLTIDPVTKLATLDAAKLDSVLSGNKQGVVDTLHAFGANFAKAAQLLDANGNFIANQLGNLGRAIGYIDSNESSLQAEFGLGDAAKPTGLAAQALAAYNETYGASAAQLTAQA